MTKSQTLLSLSQSVPTGPYIATSGPDDLLDEFGGEQSLNRSQRDRTLQRDDESESDHVNGQKVSIGPNGTVHCNRLFYDRDNLFTRNSLPISCLQEILLASSKFDKSVSPPSHSLAVFVIRSFRPPGLCLGSHHPPRTTYNSIKPTGPIQGACR